MVHAATEKRSALLALRLGALLSVVCALSIMEEIYPAQLYADDGAPIILSVSPDPPDCVLRKSARESERSLTVTGENFDSLEDWRLVFLDVQTGRHTPHFHNEVNWESPVRISVDFGLLDEYLRADEFMALRVRIMGGDPYGPLTGWSREFVLAEDRVHCGFRRPTPTPGPALPPRGIAGDPWADVILGKPDFSEGGPNQVVPYALLNPGGVIVDRSTDPGRAYIWDGGNSRILGIDLGKCYESADPCSADVVLGQPSGYDNSACNGDNGVQTFPFRAQAKADTLCGIPDTNLSPGEEHTFVSMVIDGEGNLYVPDSHNNRVLKYDSPFENDHVADQVWGQADMSGMMCNRGRFDLPSAETLCFHSDSNRHWLNRYGNGVELDARGNLWVADGGNNRVLRFPAEPDTGQIARTADLVLGQPRFSTRSEGDSKSRFHAPSAIRFDSRGWLHVADSYNDRILVFKPPFVSGMRATSEFGSRFHQPTALEIDPSGRGIWVNDSGNYMIELWDHDGTEVVQVLGKESYQPDRQCGHTERTFAEGRAGICPSAGSVGIDSRGNVLAPIYLDPSDVLRFPDPAAAYGEIIRPDRRLFYPPDSFNWQGKAGIRSARGVAVWDDQLIVADIGRLMFWNGLDSLTNGRPADGIIGETGRQTRWASCCGRLKVDSSGRLYSLGLEGRRFIDVYQLPLTEYSFPIHTIWTQETALPVLGSDEKISLGHRIFGIAPAGSGEFLWLSDTDNHRVLRIRDLFNEPVVDVILGQRDASGTVCNRGNPTDNWDGASGNPDATMICSPGALSFDSLDNLFVSDHALEVEGNWRMLVFGRDVLPRDNTSAIFAPEASKVFSTHYGAPGPALNSWERSAKIDREYVDPLRAATWEAAFDSANRMVVGYNGYIGGRFVGVYDDPLGPGTEPNSYLRDVGAMPYSITFDDTDNLYVGDLNRARVIVYLDPFDNPAREPANTSPGASEPNATPVPEHAFAIISVDPQPPQCVVRNARATSPHILEFEIERLGRHWEGMAIQFRRITFDQMKALELDRTGIRRADSGRHNLTVNMSRWGGRLWADLDRVVLTARIALIAVGVLGTSHIPDNHPLIPVSDWSPAFVLAEDEESCGTSPPVPSPAPAPTPTGHNPYSVTADIPTDVVIN